VRYIQQTFGKEVSFFDWLLVGGPFTLLFLPLAWLLITRVLFRADIGEIEGGRQHFDEEYHKLGPLTQGEKIVLAVFAVTALLWIGSPLLKGIAVTGAKPLAGLSDAGAVRDPGRSRQRHPSDGLGRGRETSVGRFDTLRGRAHAGQRHRGERRVGVHRQFEPRPGRPAPPSCWCSRSLP
jgi:Sodium:sulfate symporter transmembrane region